MSKKSKIANYILFTIASLIEVFCILFYVDTLKLLATQSLAAIAAVAILAYFILCAIAILILSIIISIIYKKIAKNYLEANMPISKLDKIFKTLPWIYTLVNIILFVILYL